MTHTNRVRISRLSLGLIAALAAAPVFAQSTSAAVGGVVTDASGQPVAGAEVTITHVESGTVSRALTDANGRYTARGLRVGGPYSITVNKAGSGTDTEDEVYLALNQQATVDAQLQNDVTTLATVQAVAMAGSEVFSASKMGTGSAVSRQVIEALPSANRNIQDYIRLDPRISQVSKADGAISAGGQNSRYNAIKIDGVSASDPFGLESNNLPTERQPVSMDAIEEINIDLANYDTTIFGGTGAVINAVTKSGTNSFSGSVYGAYRDKSWVRENLRDVEFAGFNSEKTWGATFGGPILKDRLFFFANYEKFERDAPGISLSDTPFGRNITDADIAAVQAAASAHGFEAGSLDVPGNKTEIEEYALKIDWNISDDHRFAVRYSNMEQSVARFPGLAGGTISLSSYWYDQPKTFESLTTELFSDWTQNFSTEFKVSRRDYSAQRVPYSNLPHIRINGFGNSAVLIGTEQNTHVNIVETNELTAFGAGILYAGDHTIKFGADYSENDVLNFYGRNLNGVYTFANLAAFRAGTPTQYQLRAPRAGGSIDDVPARYTLKNLGVFLQDTWAITPDFTLMFGVRMDKPDFSEQRLYNPRIHQLFGYDNTNTVDKALVQPRIGFNWSPMSDLRAQLRGGVGLFSGAAPNVWLAGTYQNTGLNYVEYDLRGAAAAAHGFSPQVPPSTAGLNPSAGRHNVDIAEPGLRLPSVWKANLAYEQELGWQDLVFSVELLATKVKDGLFFERLDIMNPTATGQDGRAIYWNAAGMNPANAQLIDSRRPELGYAISSGQGGAGVKANRPGDIGDVMLMRNTDKGKTQQLTIGVQKPLTDTWGWSAFYTRTAAWEVSPLTSSQNTSNWNNTLIFNANEEVAYRSRYAMRDRVTGTIEFRKAFFGDYNTRIGLFYEGRTGRPYSYIYYNDVNGDGANTNDLFYVPAAPGDVKWTGGSAMESAFFQWLEQNPELGKYRGMVAPANAFTAKWTNSFDLRIAQELPGFWRGHKSEISLDVMNLGNLLNKDWGLIDDYGFFSTRRVVNYAGIDPATGKYVYNFGGSTDEAQIQENNNDKGNTGASRWSVQVGFRYKF